MKEYHYGFITGSNANLVLNDWAKEGWEVFWMNRNHNAAVIDVLLVREAE